MFEPGETIATVDIPIEDDDILEDTEMFTASLFSDLPNVLVFENASVAGISIFDNDRKLAPSVSKFQCASVLFLNCRCYYWVCGGVIHSE